MPGKIPRAIPVLLLSVAALIPLWRFEAKHESTTIEVAAPATEATGVPETGTPQPGTAATTTIGAPPANASKAVAGSLIRTNYGDVQVRVTFQGDKITAVQMLKQPNSAPTKMAVPILTQETLRAQSADVDSVSGATTTSGAYVESLQAAIDAKGD